ncbi:GNAT family N-acetyltransferase [Trichloromonas acetexigens]|uniref:GNAT family N-acetyltransferase n=1 Tax=Trichloromonas acetexigens TaxID=38815 RepID=A0A550JL59_9BACT|nr:GNAT family N-acetyltransferase [Desulfuromonas acetexigens]TRO83964.1 GNAT family N-acetyltransferase [Desulfuromonas acetexigens]
MTEIRTATAADWDIFARLAAAENWRISPAERQLFRGPWAGHALALEIDGQWRGFVTAVPHQRSGWIGNLIVPPESRGRGYGRQLFAAAVARLERKRLNNLWLTASEQGRPLYKQYGFAKIDEIERWVGDGVGGGCDDGLRNNEGLWLADSRAWGESRRELLMAVANHGRAFIAGDVVIFLQQGGDMNILGPWYKDKGESDPCANRDLLRQALTAADPGRELVIDTLLSSPVHPLLAEVGFIPSRRAALMVRGGPGAARLDRMLALASLGSVG